MKKCLPAMLELYEWELREIPFVSSVIGRHVYVCLARQILQSPEPEVSGQTLKSIFSSPNFTERAIRLKVREMEREGFLRIVSHESDRRARKLIATERLVAMVENHAEVLEKIMTRDFFIMGK